MDYNVYKRMADQVESTANIASGMFKHALANELWKFERELREKAKAAKK